MRKAGLTRLAAVACTLDQALGTARWNGSQWLGGLLSGALAVDELSSVVVSLYDVGRFHHRVGLWPWEEDWYRRRLPRAPARLLVTAAGAGREASELAARGYTVDATEPAPSMAEVCRRALPADSRVWVGTHEDLNQAVCDTAGGPLSELAGREYGAVILGWGSLSHVLRAEERARTLEAAALLAPTGPVLASYLPSNSMLARRSRAWQLGELLGRKLGQSEASGLESTVSFSTQHGFVARLEQSELETIAGDQLGRQLVDEAQGAQYPHVTLLAPGSAPE